LCCFYGWLSCNLVRTLFCHWISPIRSAQFGQMTTTAASRREWAIGDELWTLAYEFVDGQLPPLERVYRAGTVVGVDGKRIMVRLDHPEDFDGKTLGVFDASNTTIWREPPGGQLGSLECPHSSQRSSGG